MAELLPLLLKISLILFMVGNLLDMGLRLQPGDTLRGLRNLRFVAWTLGWGFVLGPVLALGITRVIPLAAPYAMGLILIGMTPCAPFLPMIIDRARGDLASTAAFMVICALGTVAFMPLAMPLLIDGLSVSAWRIARPLLLLILLPLALGVGINQAAPGFAARLQPWVRKLAASATLATFVMILLIYGKELLGVPGSLALAAQLLFFSIVTACSFQFAMGLGRAQRVVLSAGLATRNLGAAVAPLLSLSDVDQRAIVMVVLSLPVTVVFAMLVAALARQRGAAGRDHA